MARFSLTIHATCGQFFHSTGLLTLHGYCLILLCLCAFLQDCYTANIHHGKSALSISAFAVFRRRFLFIIVFCVFLFLVKHHPGAGVAHPVRLYPVAGVMYTVLGEFTQAEFGLPSGWAHLHYARVNLLYFVAAVSIIISDLRTVRLLSCWNGSRPLWWVG